MLNLIKKEQVIPSLLRSPNITSIYKNKGAKDDLDNERGIFVLSVVRSILDKMIYKDKYEEVDRSISDSQVGTRKRRNVRNHLFVIYGIQNYIRVNKNESVDLLLYNLEKCFDSEWTSDVMNDMYEACEVRDDKLSLMHEANKEAFVAINTPVGQTKRARLLNIEMQGSVLGPIRCGAHIDTIGKRSINAELDMYVYKGTVTIPPLEMIDDIATITKCGLPSLQMNNYINRQVEMKKLRFNCSKCKKIHLGAKCLCCPTLYAHDSIIKESSLEKYVGDMISEDCTVQKCLAFRVSKGIGIIAQLMSLLAEVTLGVHYFEVAMQLRESIFLNGILFNTEVWYGLKEQDMKELEHVDEMLLRKLMMAHRSTPKESLYLPT